MIQYINPNKNWHKSCKTIALQLFHHHHSPRFAQADGER